MFQDPFNVCMRFHVAGIKSCFCAYMFIFGNLLIQLKVILTFNDSNKDGWVLRVWISNSRLYCIDIREHTCGCNFSKGHSFNGETLGIHAVIFRPRGQVVSGGWHWQVVNACRKCRTSHRVRTVPACVDHLNSVRATHSLVWHDSTRRTIMASQVGCVC